MSLRSCQAYLGNPARCMCACVCVCVRACARVCAWASQSHWNKHLVDLLSATPLQCSDGKPGDLPKTLIFGSAGQLLPSSECNAISKKKKRNRTFFEVWVEIIPLHHVFGLLGQQEKGNTPLHIAAKAGQMLQAELLAVYGADPGALDSSGKTPIDYAR